MFRTLMYSDFYMPVITSVVCIGLWKHIAKKEFVIIFYSLFSSVLFTVADALGLRTINNMPLYHTYTLVEIWLVSFYLLKKITGKNFSPAFWAINIGYLIFFIANIIFFENLWVFNSNSAGLSSLVILFLCMYYLLKLSNSDEILYFQKLPSFWITSGFLIYNAVSVLVLLSYKYFTYIHLPNEGNNLWLVLSVANIVKFALIITGLLCHKKRPATHLPFLL